MREFGDAMAIHSAPAETGGAASSDEGTVWHPRGGAGRRLRPRWRGRIAALAQRQRTPSVGPMLLFTGAEASARLLSFLFYILAARALDPRGFGVVRYTIVVSLIAFGGLQVAVNAISRELGAAREDPGATAEVLGSALLAVAVAFGVTVVVCVVARLVGLIGGAPLVPLLVVVAGLTMFQAYYCIGRGLGRIKQPALSYVGASLAQLVAFLIAVAVTTPSATTALYIYGASSAVPILVFEAVNPMVLRQKLVWSRNALVLIRRTAAPLLLGQVCFVIWNSADQIWVQHSLGAVSVGYYGSARNLSQLLAVIPAGVAGVMLPNVAQLHSAGEIARARRLTLGGTATVMLCSSIIAFVVIAIRRPLLTGVYGAAYGAASGALFAVVVGMVLTAGVVSIANAAIGYGRARMSTIATGIAAVVEVAILILGRGHSPTFAGIAFAAGSAGALIFLLGWLVVGQPGNDLTIDPRARAKQP